MIPASAIAFFDSGPFAWNGLFGIYLPLALFVIWFNLATYHVVKAIQDEKSTDVDIAVLQE